MSENYRGDFIRSAEPLLSAAKEMVSALSEEGGELVKLKIPGYYLANKKQEDESFLFIEGFELDGEQFFVYQKVEQKP